MDAFARYARIITRGQGGPALKDGFCLFELAALDGHADQAADGALPHEAATPFAATVLGTWFLTRGIELSAALVIDMVFDDEARVVTWNLPVSKSDPRAVGQVRKHGCVCQVNPAV